MADDVVLLDDLPVVIDGPGDYFTRSGRRAIVREVKPGATFTAKGAFYTMFRGNVVARGHVGWHVSGRYNAVAPHPNDLVRKA